MAKPTHLHPSDLRALARLVADATVGVTGIVEAVHIGIAPPVPSPSGRGLGRGPATVEEPSPPVPSPPGRGSADAEEPSPNPSQRAGDQRRGGIAPLTYRTIRSATRFIGAGMDAALAPLAGLLGPRQATPQRRAALAALNGVLGDYLAETNSPLALPLTFHSGGAALPTDRAALAAALPRATGRVLLLVHGLCLGDACWECAGGGLGGALARELGYTPVAVSYNNGRHISTNGRELAAGLDLLLGNWPRPVAELVIVGHSMGGLVARSACHYGAGTEWPARLRALITLGTPHHGTPLERGGNWINIMMDGSPYAAPFSRLGKGRSAGITDLRYGSLVDEDWHGHDRFAHREDERAIVPLPRGARCYAVAGTLGEANGTLRDRLLGDGLVPLDSALGRHADPARALPFDDTWIAPATGHRDLLTRAEVIERVGLWLE